MLPDEAARAMATELCVMFVGSGVSVPSPSDLLSAHAAVSAFVRAAADDLVATSVMDELLDRRGVLPEFIYGLVERHFGDDIYTVWGSLELWRTRSGAFAPSAGHFAAVHVAARSQTPLLTPNFDTFLEEAAERLGLQPRVSVATPGRAFKPGTAREGEVAIWKLHGTALTPSSVFSSVRTLTRPVQGLSERLREAVPAEARLVLAGYSGRDLDLFPALAAGQYHTEPIWVDLHFGSDHRAHLLNPAATQVVAPFDEVARLYALHSDDKLRGAIGASDQLARSSGHAALSTALKADITRAFQKAAEALNGEAGRRLLLGELLINGGMAETALEVVRGATCEGAARSEQARLLAKAEWELGHFHSSEMIAGQRLRERVPPAERHILRFAVIGARMRSSMPPGGLEGVFPARNGEVTWVAIQAIATFLAAVPRALRPDLVPEPTRTPLVEGWVEHGIRMLGTVQARITPRSHKVPIPAARALVWVWRALRRMALRTGYAEGVGNVGRYLDRLGVSDPDGIRGTHEFLGHFLGVGIGHRDAAWRAIDRGDTALAMREYEQGLKLARLQKDPVLLLTFRPLAKSLGIELDVDRTTVAGIEADWAAAFLEWLDAHGPAGE